MKDILIRASVLLLILVVFSPTSFAQNWDQFIKAAASDRAWRYQADRAAGDYFGTSVAIDGNYAVVGATFDEDTGPGLSIINNGSALLFKKDGSGQWQFLKKLKATDFGQLDDFGCSVAISGNTIVIGARLEDQDAAGGSTLNAAGSAYVFSKDQGGTDNWGQVKKLVASDRAAGDNFGFSISIDGNNVVIGAYGESEDASGGSTLSLAGSAYLFNKDAGGTDNWGQVKKLVASDRGAGDVFGYSVAINGNNIVVGSYNESEDASGGSTLSLAGAAYVFGKDVGGTDNWGQFQKIVASDRGANDRFGGIVTINGGNIIVGVSQEDEDANGTSTITSSGSVYIFANASVLPLTWGSFTTEKKQHNVLLKWSTLQEQNTQDFTIQHSANGRNWIAIGNVNAAGFSNSIQQYAYTHTAPVSGKNFYRLLQTDLDGKKTYSDVRQLNWSAVNKMVFYSNPVTNGVLHFQMEQAGEIQIFSVNGQLLLSKKAKQGRQSVDVDRLSAGYYIIRVGDKTSPLIIQ